jgi:hypothetical protein
MDIKKVSFKAIMNSTVINAIMAFTDIMGKEKMNITNITVNTVAMLSVQFFRKSSHCYVETIRAFVVFVMYYNKGHYLQPSLGWKNHIYAKTLKGQSN